jgi:hypothetical protein
MSVELLGSSGTPLLDGILIIVVCIEDFTVINWGDKIGEYILVWRHWAAFGDTIQLPRHVLR